MTGRSGNSNVQDVKRQGDRGRCSATRDVGDGWRGEWQVDRRLLNVYMQDGRISKEWRMGLIVPIWKRKGGWA